MISAKGLNKYFNKGKLNELHVINDVSLQLPEKGMTAIFGKSGCGKTTLLNVIGGLDSFSGGELSVEGSDIRKNTDDVRNRYIGYIFQNYNLNKNESCFDNVAAALRLCGMTDTEEIERRVKAALKNVGMENYAKRSPDTLSGGQQQRIAIARAIVKNPRIILADEPTGNLDEANTVMIMDLLKAISREHLVILVTHEANLVDYYCDTVIELSDGKVVGTRNNSVANGFVARDKNDIYLGELEKQELSDQNALVEYYGDAPSAPVRLKIINSGGKIYVKIGSEKVHILDETSEIRLRDGVYTENGIAESTEEKRLDMSELPPVTATETGKLFTLTSSLKSAYKANFLGERKKGKKVLKRFMALFASVVVFISAIFGTAFKDISEADGAYNHNVFYLYTPDGETSDTLLGAVGSADSAIDYVRIMKGYPSGDAYLAFRAGSFETFVQYDFSSVFGTNAVLLDASLASELPLIEGKKDSLLDDEMVITSKVADALIEKSTLGYIKDERDLIGLVMITSVANGKTPRITGVVESDETAVYMNEMTMARYAHYFASPSQTALASDNGITLAKGEVVLAIRERRTDVEYPELNGKIKIQGMEFTVKAIKEFYGSYDNWLVGNGIKKTDEYTYFTSIVKENYPTLAENSTEFSQAFEAIRNEKLFEFYDYYYSEIHAFCRDLLFFESYNIDAWFYCEKGLEAAKYIYLPEYYFKANEYKKLNGRYPTVSELEAVYTNLPDLFEVINGYYAKYKSEFYGTDRGHGVYSNRYLVSDADYISLSKRQGETHPSAKEPEYYFYDTYYEGEYEDYVMYSSSVYTVIHSSDPEKTDAWLRSAFPNLEESDDSARKKLISPTDVYESIVESGAEEITADLIAMAIIIAITSVCMYFIMHASVMNRIKEIGIYRAIGVSKKNLIFKFFIEAALLTVLTVLVGYILSSIFLGVITNGTSLIADIFYYPVWLALAVLGTVCSVTLFFGTLPIILLLRKTPSQILAKYDI